MAVAGVTLNDFHVYSPAYMTWFDLSSHAYGTPPTARAGHGFASAGGKLYVHGGRGLDKSGERVGRSRRSFS